MISIVVITNRTKIPVSVKKYDGLEVMNSSIVFNGEVFIWKVNNHVEFKDIVNSINLWYKGQNSATPPVVKSKIKCDVK